MKENIKLALLAVIATTLIFNTIMMSMSGDKRKYDRPGQNSATPASLTSHDGHDHDNPLNPEPSPITPEVNTGPVTSIQFAESTHNFGNIKQDTKNVKKFKFKNTGSNPLIIENATGSCGCTVPEYPKEPIAPGASAEITVEYSPGKQQGQNTKTVTITANTEPKQTTLTIMANVEEVN
jgi:hypothetical protein